MATEASAPALTPAEHLDRHIREHLERAEQWRAENGDPSEAMGAFLRERIGLKALQETYDEYKRHEDSFLFDDYDSENDDEVDEGFDGRQPG